jgi:UDPglucose 6-dehydrogenase
MNINVMGLGKLGFPMASFLSAKHNVQCFDLNHKLVDLLKKNSKSYLPNEIGINRYLKKKIKIFDNAQESLLETKISFITVPTPSLENGKFSNKFILSVLDDIAHHIKNNIRIKKNKDIKPYIININSTVSPGSFSKELMPYMERKGLKINKDYYFIYNPYFVALGNVIENLEKPDFILIGHSSEKALNEIKKLYANIYKKPKIKSMNLEEAELVKLLVNCYVASKISFTNFVKDITDKFKITSASRVLDAIGTDKRVGNNFFKPGGPFLGPCLPRDTIALKKFCEEINIEPLIPITTNKINNLSITKIYETLNGIRSMKFKNIGFIGTGYKPNTEFFEESIAYKIMKKAKKLKFNVCYFDRFITKDHNEFKRFNNIKDLIKISDVIFISYHDPYIKRVKKFFKKKNIIWDIYNVINSEKIKKFSSIAELKNLK